VYVSQLIRTQEHVMRMRTFPNEANCLQKIDAARL
jgi:hypothetical protein